MLAPQALKPYAETWRTPGPNASEFDAMPNRLISETSPYLRQHADNPVDWYPWGEEAFERARREDKPIHLSVGYAACHWCHVMAHESFEDPTTAQLLNEEFVSIKLDRQERPDLDEIYQKVVQMMGMGGGWPLTVFLTPAGEPFFGGTYFPPRDGHGRPGFPRLLRALSDAWRTDRAAIRDNVDQFRAGYRQLDERLVTAGQPRRDDAAAVAARGFASATDRVHGGLGGAPKFPNPHCCDLILRVYHRTHEPELLEALETTLDRMAAGGIYDHLGGGFSRYSVDEFWAVPHFEKMLYDNAQLVRLYADAYRLTGKPSWRHTFEHTIAYILRDMTSPQGGFYSSEDADSEGKEGRYYVWTSEQILSAIGEEDGRFACRAYGVSERGNFEHGATVLSRAVQLDADEEIRLGAISAKLLDARSSRVRPGRDENILTSWNALMIQGLCAAYQATGRAEYLNAAKRAADFIRERLQSPQVGLLRVYNGGSAKIHGFLDDYAFLANALLDLYESCFDAHYLNWAIQLAEDLLQRFWDEGFYYAPLGGEPLIHRPRAPLDNAIPSGNSAATFALLRLHELTGNQLYRDRAETSLDQFSNAAARNPFGFAHLLAAGEFRDRGPMAVVFAGQRDLTAPLLRRAQHPYLPARVLAFAEDVPIGSGKSPLDGDLTAYVCRDRVCRVPVTDGDALAKSLDDMMCRVSSECTLPNRDHTLDRE